MKVAGVRWTWWRVSGYSTGSTTIDIPWRGVFSLGGQVTKLARSWLPCSSDPNHRGCDAFRRRLCSYLPCCLDHHEDSLSRPAWILCRRTHGD